MYHSLNVEIAKEVGANSALIFNHFLHWITKNKANGDNFNEGRYWTYASNKSLEDLFPYFTTDQIRTAIKKLKDKDLILTGNFNKSSYDRTTWYALTDYAESLLQKSPLFFDWNQWTEGKKSSATSSEMITRQSDAVKDLKGGNK